MREIKFRGIDVKKNEYVYGFFYIFGDKYFIIEYGKLGIPEQYIEVFIESVGEFTGLRDKKGKEIYEGDIVNTKDFNGGFTNVVVEFDDAQFTTIIKPLNRLIDIVVIGNIYENKKLLDK